MPSYMIDGQILSDIADAIRSKTGSSAPIAGEDMASEIMVIPSGRSPYWNNVETTPWALTITDITIS